MEMLVPFSSVEQLMPLIETGVTEVFCGYVDEKWQNRFHQSGFEKTLIYINKRENLYANVTSMEELKEIVKITDKYNVKLFLTINALYYSDKVWEFLKDYIKEIENAGIKHVIVSDIALMDYITNNTNLKITVSCLNNVINSYQVDFYKQFNIERIVFPRHISIENIKKICENYPDLDFEYFILSDKCLYDDGNCHCCHSLGAFCIDSWTTDYFSLDDEIPDTVYQKLKNNEIIYKKWSHNQLPTNKEIYKWKSIGCSLCSLYNTVKLPNIKSLKIVGRGYSLNNIMYMVDVVKKAIAIAEKHDDIRKICDYAKTAFNNQDMCETYNYCIVRGK